MGCRKPFYEPCPSGVFCGACYYFTPDCGVSPYGPIQTVKYESKALKDYTNDELIKELERRLCK